MGAETEDGGGGTLPPKESDSKELLKYLREENEKNRTALRKDAEATRKFFVESMKLVSYPLTALVVIAGFLGWNNISTFREDLKNQAQAEVKRLVPTEVARQVPAEVEREVPAVVNREVPVEVERAVPQAVDREVRSVVPSSANEEVKRVLPTAINQAITQTVVDTKSQTEAAIRDKVTESLGTQQVQETISNAISNSDVLKTSIASQIEAEELKAREASQAAEEGAKASAPYEPQLKQIYTSNEFEINADQSLTVKTHFVNDGQYDAVNITSYSVTKLSTSSDDPMTRIGIFRDLAKEIALSRRSQQGMKLQAKLPWGKGFDLSAKSAPLSSDEAGALRKASNSIYFMFYVSWEGPQGFTDDVIHCGSIDGDLTFYKTCAYDGINDNYYNIIKAPN